MSQTLLLPAYCALLFHFLILGEKITKVRKGQLISRGLFDVFQLVYQKINEIFVMVSALASKKRSDQKSKGTLYH